MSYTVLRRAVALMTVALVAMTLVVPVAAQPQPQPSNTTVPRKPLAFMVPDGTLAFLTLPSFPQAKQELQTWEIKRILDLPEFKAMFKPLWDELQKQLDAASKQIGAESGLTLDTLLGLLAGQVSIALLDVDSQNENRAEQAKLLVAVDVDRTTEALGKALSWLQKAAAKDGKVTTSKIDEIEVTTVETPQVTLSYALVNQSLLLTNQLDSLKGAVKFSKAASSDGSLGAADKFKKVRSGLTSSGELLFAYFDMEKVFDALYLAQPEWNRENFQRGMEVAGMNSLKAIGANVTLREGVLRDNLYLYAPGNRKGVLQVLSLPATPMATVKFAPENAVSYGSWYFDFELLWTEIQEAVRSADEEAYERMKQNLDEQAQRGFDFVTNLFGAVGGEMGAWSYYDAANKPVFGVYITLKNPQGFGVLLDNLAAMAAETESFPLSVEKDGERKTFVLDLTQQQQQQLAMMESRLPPYVVEPIMQFYKQHGMSKLFGQIVRNALVLSNTTDEIKFVRDHPQGREKHLGQKAEFVKAREQGFATPSVFFWTNWPKMVEPYYGLAEEIVKAVIAEQKAHNGQPKLPLAMGPLPKLADIQKILTSGADVEMRVDKNGLLLRTRGVVSAAVMAGVGMALYQMRARRGGGGNPDKGEDE